MKNKNFQSDESHCRARGYGLCDRRERSRVTLESIERVADEKSSDLQLAAVLNEPEEKKSNEDASLNSFRQRALNRSTISTVSSDIPRIRSSRRRPPVSTPRFTDTAVNKSSNVK